MKIKMLFLTLILAGIANASLVLENNFDTTTEGWVVDSFLGAGPAAYWQAPGEIFAKVDGPQTSYFTIGIAKYGNAVDFSGASSLADITFDLSATAMRNWARPGNTTYKIEIKAVGSEQTVSGALIGAGTDPYNAMSATLDNFALSGGTEADFLNDGTYDIKVYSDNAPLGAWWGPTTGNRYGIAVERVAIDAVPEPATFGLMALFGGGLLFARRRFKM